MLLFMTWKPTPKHKTFGPDQQTALNNRGNKTTYSPTTLMVASVGNVRCCTSCVVQHVPLTPWCQEILVRLHLKKNTIFKQQFWATHHYLTIYRACMCNVYWGQQIQVLTKCTPNLRIIIWYLGNDLQVTYWCQLCQMFLIWRNIVQFSYFFT